MADGWRELLEHCIEPFDDMKVVRFGGTHDAVVYAVIAGEVDAGTVRSDTIDAWPGKDSSDKMS